VIAASTTRGSFAPRLFTHACAVQSICFIGHNPISLIPNPRDLDDIVNSIAKVKPTAFAGVPTLFNGLLNHRRVKSGGVSFDSLKVCVSGAAPLLAETKKRFWKDCLRALAPGGALGINWAEFVGVSRMQDEARAIAGSIGRSFFIAERVAHPNVVQLAPTARGFSMARLPACVKRFADMYRLPREDREILRRNDVLSHNPLLAWR